MYSYAISGMSRETMKMDSRDSAECQNWEKKDLNVIFGIVKLEKDKIINSVCLLQNSKGENVKWSRGHSGQHKWSF